MELGAGWWVAIVVVECEAESFGEPCDGLAYVGIDDVGEDIFWGNGAIFDHRAPLVNGLTGGEHWNGSENFQFGGRINITQRRRVRGEEVEGCGEGTGVGCERD